MAIRLLDIKESFLRELNRLSKSDMTDEEYGDIIAKILVDQLQYNANVFDTLKQTIADDKKLYFDTRAKIENQYFDTLSTLDKLNLKRVYDAISDTDKENRKKVDELIERAKKADTSILKLVYQFIDFKFRLDIESEELKSIDYEMLKSQIIQFKIDQIDSTIDDYMFEYSDQYYQTMFNKLALYNQKIAYENVFSKHLSKRTIEIIKKLVSAYNRVVYNTSSINDIIGIDRRFIQETNCGNTISNNPDIIACGTIRASNFIAEIENKRQGNLWISCCDLHKKEIEVSDRFTILLEQSTISSKYSVIYISANRIIHQLIPHHMHTMMEFSWTAMFGIFTKYRPPGIPSTRVFIELFKFANNEFVPCDDFKLLEDGSILHNNNDIIATIDIFSLISELHSYDDKIQNITTIYENCIHYI